MWKKSQVRPLTLMSFIVLIKITVWIVYFSLKNSSQKNIENSFDNYIVFWKLG